MKAIVSIFCVLYAFTGNGQKPNSNNLLSSDTLTIYHFKYIVQLTEDNNFQIFCNNDTLIERDYYPADAEFIDFDEDGYTDIYLTFLSNVPRLNDLFLFDSLSKCFKKVEGFREFPDAQKLVKGYYYSYHRSGCADYNWDSDLFYIKDFKAIKIANIHVVECNDEPKKGVFVYDLTSSMPVLADFIKSGKIKGDKWKFIQNYWKKNHKNYLKRTGNKVYK